MAAIKKGDRRGKPSKQANNIHSAKINKQIKGALCPGACMRAPLSHTDNNQKVI